MRQSGKQNRGYIQLAATGRAGNRQDRQCCKAICKQRPYGYFHTNKTLTTKEPFSGSIQQKHAPCSGYLLLTSMTPEWKIELIALALFQLQSSVTMLWLTTTSLPSTAKLLFFLESMKTAERRLVFTVSTSAFVLLETH